MLKRSIELNMKACQSFLSLFYTTLIAVTLSVIFQGRHSDSMGIKTSKTQAGLKLLKRAVNGGGGGV